MSVSSEGDPEGGTRPGGVAGVAAKGGGQDLGGVGKAEVVDGDGQQVHLATVWCASGATQGLAVDRDRPPLWLLAGRARKAGYSSR
jgi:hypothetical protein